LDYFINAQNFSIVKPEKWRGFEDHGYVSYTPLHKKNNPFENSVSVFQYRLKEKITFKDLVENRINETTNSRDIVSQKSYSEQNRLGLVYIHEIESLFQGEVYNKSFYMYFEHHGYYYNYNYSSREDLYQTYFTDAMSILNSIEFVEKKIDI
tara:strand:- start:19385 stop:19840 length:456 start_codon:yes stop_codon:yes gene_type:complete